MKQVPLKNIIQVQYNSEWKKLKEDYKRGNKETLYNFFKKCNKDKYVLDVLTPEWASDSVWYIKFLWEDLYLNSSYIEHGVRKKVNLEKYEKYIIFMYYFTSQVTESNFNHINFPGLYNKIEKLSRDYENSNNIKDKPAYLSDRNEVLVLLSLFDGEYFEMVKSLL